MEISCSISCSAHPRVIVSNDLITEDFHCNLVSNEGFLLVSCSLIFAICSLNSLIFDSEGMGKVMFSQASVHPHQGDMYPHLADAGYAGQVRMGHTPSGQDRGTPHNWMGYPLSALDRGIPSPGRQSSIVSNCYMAGGVPLVFMEDFLVLRYFRSCSLFCLVQMDP